MCPGMPWKLTYKSKFSNYLKKDIVDFAKANPQIEVVVEQRPAHHPVIRGEYRKSNGFEVYTTS
jgi:hypothetical protein